MTVEWFSAGGYLSGVEVTRGDDHADGAVGAVGVAVSVARRDPGTGHLRTGDLVDDWVAAASCSSPSLGPAGRAAYVSDRDGTPRLWLRDATGERRPVDTGAGHVRSVVWSPDGAWIAVMVAPGGGEHTEVRVIRPDGTGLRRLAGGPHPVADLTGTVTRSREVPATSATPVVLRPANPSNPGSGRGSAVDAGAVSAATLGRWTPDGAAVALCESVGSGMTHALLVDPETGRREHLAAGQALAICDIDGDARSGYRLLLREGPRGVRRLILVDSATGRFHLLLDAAATVGLGRFGAGVGATDRDVVYLLSDAGRERVVLMAVTLSGGGEPGVAEVVAARDDADLERFVLLASGGATERPSAVLAWNVDGHSVLELVDLGSGSRRSLPPLPREVAGSLLVHDGGRGLLLALVGSTVPGELWTYDLTQLSDALSDPASVPLSDPAGYRCLVSDAPTAFPAPALASVLPALPAARPQTRLVRPVLHRFSAHDGLELSGWLYRPVGGPGPHPTLVFFHGGPEAQERPAFNPLFQALVTRGVAVFAPNVRGSSGYGRSFVDADNHRRRLDGIADVASCVRYLVAAGLADGDRVGVAGRSYGGYLTLAALVTYPELFRVGVDICGMADFASFYAHTEPWIAGPAVTKYGDPVADAGLLRELSPLYRMHRLAAPLLVVHGVNDTNVPVIEAEQAVAAASAAGVDCRYLLFDGEGHEIVGLENRTVFVRETVEWVSGHLLKSGRVESGADEPLVPRQLHGTQQDDPRQTVTPMGMEMPTPPRVSAP